MALARVRARGVDHSLLANVEFHRVDLRGPNPNASCWYLFIDCVRARFIARFILLFVGLWQGSRSVHSRWLVCGRIIRYVKLCAGYVSYSKITLPLGHESGDIQQKQLTALRSSSTSPQESSNARDIIVIISLTGQSIFVQIITSARNCNTRNI